MTDVLRERSLEILDATGDTKVIWDPENEAEVEAAKAQFDALRKKGFAAFRVKGVTGAKGAKITEWDPDAEKMILVPPMAGG